MLPVETLFPLPHRVKSDDEAPRLRNVTGLLSSAPSIVQLGFPSSRHGPSLEDSDRTDEHPEEGLDDEGFYDEFSDYVPYDEVEGVAMVRKGLLKRAPAFRGTMQMDCKVAREACQNACWYQNCVRGARGASDQVVYREGGGVSEEVDANRDHILAGGREWRNFRRARGKYGEGQPYAHWREGRGKFIRGDWFYVNFDMSSFDNQDPNDRWVMDNVLYYCNAPFKNCENDGRQFHMSELVETNSRRNLQVGVLEWPYDRTGSNKYGSQGMSEYQVDNEGEAIKAFNLVLKVTGNDKDQFDVTVSEVVNGVPALLASNTQQLATDESMSVQGSLPQSLKISRTDDCEVVKFEYGSDGELSFFPFNTKDAGYPDNAPEDRKKGANRGRYCLPSDIEDSNGDAIGVEYDCWFPGW
ncbi:uncharacterized protein LTR77_008086 [Saxophila tyrrhenica]|uniref:Uncharacterized protein n=1 Tax=Saxophila tyrrhenica TaxID=1690608 RepID=A0AAV9P556_9PEZI|nr:hypothetical protein LTR77_008086 [Saxophila tyrrhenica]